jgi:4-diphosphocytidyl-2C-methyl-D-erythritol kinase
MEDIQYIDPNDDWYIPDDERDYETVPAECGADTPVCTGRSACATAAGEE